MKKTFIMSVCLGVVTALPAVAAEPSRLEKVVDKLTAECSGNGSGSSVTPYDVKKFDAKKAMAQFKDIGENKCRRIYSTSKADGVKMTVSYMRERYTCPQQSLTGYELEVLTDAIEDKTNLAVFASIHDDPDNSEGCSFWHFEIYRKNGELIDIEFDETD